MRSIASLLLAFLLLFVASALHAADNGNVTGIPPDLGALELFTSPGDATPLRTVTAKDVAFPLPILEVSDNGMFRLQVSGSDVWVISDDVLTDRSRAVDASCEPKVAGTMVAHGKRGAGEGCK